MLSGSKTCKIVDSWAQRRGAKPPSSNFCNLQTDASSQQAESPCSILVGVKERINGCAQPEHLDACLPDACSKPLLHGCLRLVGPTLRQCENNNRGDRFKRKPFPSLQIAIDLAQSSSSGRISVRSLNLYDVRLIRLQASRIYGHDWDGWVKESEPARAKQRQVASASHLPPACTAPCQQAWQMEYRHLKAARVRNAMP